MTKKKTKKVVSEKIWAIVNQFGELEDFAVYQLTALERAADCKMHRPLGVYKIVPATITYEI